MGYIEIDETKNYLLLFDNGDGTYSQVYHIVDFEGVDEGWDTAQFEQGDVVAIVEGSLLPTMLGAALKMPTEDFDSMAKKTTVIPNKPPED